MLAATPFEHDIEITTGDVAKTKHLPSTVSLQCHFTNNSSMTPFIGAGIDFAISEKAAIRTDLRYIDIETDANSGGAALGKIKIDPVVFGVSYVMKF